MRTLLMKKLFVFVLIIFGSTGLTTAQDLAVVLEAEQAELGTDYESVEENDIIYVRPGSDLIDGSFPGDDAKMITFTVTFTEAGNWHLYAKIRVGSGNYNDDSFFLARDFGLASPVNADDWHVVNGLVPVGHTQADEVVTGAGDAGQSVWKWVNISAFINAQSPLSYQVDEPGATLHFRIGAREDGLDFDKIAFGKAALLYTVENLEKGEAGSEKETGGDDDLPEEAFSQVKTFINPILPGDHPDLTLLKDGDDFYACGSHFHFTPYLALLHSTDLVHWKVLTRVVPSDWSGLISDAPQAGTWAGVITYFYDSYWMYFSNTAGGGQYFCKAAQPEGPWSTPVKMRTTSTTGPVGYDNSVFVDDDGRPYMLIKPGQHVNRIQEIGTDGHLKGEALILDWVNANGEYSWAEGPVMCKRNGWYYYFVAGNVYGGQYVLRSRSLSDDPASWEAMGSFFGNVSDPEVTFRSPNHIAQPFQLDDGSWWTISHSYESLGNDNWNGQGRQGMLHQVIWDENGKPTGKAPTSTPQLKPDLPKSGIPWKTPRSDNFEKENIELTWHFMNRNAAARYSLNEKAGWLTLDPGSSKTHILHKEARHHYTLITRVDFNATAQGEEAGIYLTNGNESVTAELYSGFNEKKIIGFRFGNTKYEVENTMGNVVWLKVFRYGHQLAGFYSSNGIKWHQVGSAISVTALDKGQENYNWWVGTSNGLYAARKKAHFDKYAFKDGFSVLPIVGYNNYFGLESTGTGSNTGMINTSDKGGWLLFAGVDLGEDDRLPVRVEVAATATAEGTLELWVDDLENEGTLITTIDVKPTTGGSQAWEKFSADVSNLSRQHDVYLRWKGPARSINVRTLQFFADESFYTGIGELQSLPQWKSYPNPFIHSFSIETEVEEAAYSIYAPDGKQMEAGIIKNSHQQLGHRLQAGIYFLICQSKVEKIIKLK